MVFQCSFCPREFKSLARIPPEMTIETVEKIKLPYVKIVVSKRYKQYIEVHADGKQNVLRLLKVVDVLRGEKREYQT